MVGILIVSHGKLAEALISSVQSIIGTLQRVGWISIWPKFKKDEVKNQILEKMAEVDDGDGIVILTDVMDGSPINLSISSFKNKKVEIVTGVNMPMLLTLASYRKGRSLNEISKLVKKSGRRSIILAKEVLSLRRRKRVERMKIF